ncbi:hypothetical protein QE152_g40797 [Popillia japonica]|uniref:Uncharacterized protein n=1 Tax=Popillia japonica TaxID=7064 RepID=A0AAW1HFH6_POPJA
MNIITSNTIAEKLSSASVTCNSLHPGVVITPIHNKLSHELTLSRHIIQKILLPIIGKSVWEGAQTQIELALSKQLQHVSGKYFVDCKPVFQPWKTRDKDFCMKLWKISEELVRLEEHEKL